MKTSSVYHGAWVLSLILASALNTAFAHGLMEDPPSRNWFCGVITKPDEVNNGTAEYPECGNAFANDFNGGYQFMSVLTHDRGRSQVTPLPNDVCGFGSETWQGGATPWDTAMDWPTTPMSAGRQEIKWNIQWGPHFSDTEEFRYWITKSNFQFDPAQPLTWNDFETNPFCILTYDDANPNANPDVIPLTSSTQFRTFCDIPSRQGRHVIYGEWGRNQWTLERFHGCLDVVFSGGGSGGTVNAQISLSPGVDPFIGAGSAPLDGSASQGSNLTYTWSVSAPDTSLYTFSDTSSDVTTLTLAEPNTAQTVTISLLVSNGNASSSASVSFLHEPQAVSMYTDLGQLTSTSQTLQAGDAVSVRTVLDNGQDIFYPIPPLTLDGTNAAADAWPLALAQAVNSISNVPIAVGILGSNDQVVPIANANANRIYALIGSGIVSAFLQVDVSTNPPPNGNCIVTVRDGINPWWAGLDVGFDSSMATLDFTGTGLDLSHNVTLDSGVFTTSVSGQVITLTKPAWVSSSHPGYMGFNGNNNPALGNLTAPSCTPQ